MCALSSVPSLYGLGTAQFLYIYLCLSKELPTVQHSNKLLEDHVVWRGLFIELAA